jgi:hypothetical protein
VIAFKDILKVFALLQWMYVCWAWTQYNSYWVHLLYFMQICLSTTTFIFTLIVNMWLELCLQFNLQELNLLNFNGDQWQSHVGGKGCTVKWIVGTCAKFLNNFPTKHQSSSVLFAIFLFCEAPDGDHPEKNWAKFEYINFLARWT